MPSDVLITPASSKIEFTDGANATKTLKITGTSLNTDTSFAIGATTANNTLSVLGSASIGSSYNVAGPTNGLIVQGNVGIGITSPSNTKLHIVGDWVSGHSTVKVQGITDNTTGYGFYDTAGSRLGYLAYTGAAFEWYNNANVPVIFYSNTLERMRIAADGKVGIGTTSPASKLHIYDSTYSFTRCTNTANAGHYVDIGANSAGQSFLFSYGAYPVLLGTNGTERIRILSDGNVGIGTANPATKLEVYGVVRITESASGSILQIQAGSSALDFASTFYGGTYRPFTFTNGGSEKMRIQSDGNVGIGITSPNASLHIKPTTLGANGFILERYAGTAKLVYAYESAADGYLEVRNGSDSIVSKISGYVSTASYFLSNVGVGTASPSNKVTIEADATGASFADNSVGQLIIRGATNTAKRLGLGIDTTNNVGVIQAQLYGTGQYPLALNPAGGYVGIGTTSPTQKLDIVGSYATAGDSSGILKIRGGATGGDTQLNFGVSADGGYGWIQATDVGITNNINIVLNPIGGNVGIGATVASAKLHVAGTTGLYQSAGSTYLYYDHSGVNTWRTGIFTDNTSSYIIGHDAGGIFATKILTITMGGNVGINTTTPAYKLEVIGDARVSGGIVNSGLSAQWTLSGGGTATYDGSNIIWSVRILAIPIEKTEFGNDGYIDISCPTSGTITYYNSSNVTTTVTCTASGIPISSWEALYYEVTPGQSATSDPTKFRLVNYVNSTWRPSSNWILVCVKNGDGTGALKWIPGQVTIPAGGTYSFIDGTNNWQIAGTTNYVAKFTSANKVGNSVLYDNGANIGIGTASPGAPLTIYKASNPWIRLNGGGNFSYIQMDDGTSYGYLFKNTTSDTSNGALAGAMYTYTDSGKAFQHIHSGVPLFTILSGGNVGIGLTNPSQKLEVAGFVMAGTTYRTSIGASGSGAYIYFGDTSNLYSIGRIGGYNSLFNISSFNGSISFQISDSEKVRIDSNGNVGIGTTSPSSKLHLDDINAPWITISRSGTPTWQLRNNYPNNQYGFSFNNTTAGTVPLFIGAGGNIGLGIDNPSVRLDIASTQANGIVMRYDTTTAYQAWIRPYWNSGTDSRVDFAINRSANVTPDVIMSVGYGTNVGIGTTTPSYRLHVSQAIPTGTTSAPANTSIQVDSNTNNYLSFVNTADNGTYAGLTFVDNNVGGYIVFRNYTGDVSTGSDSLIYGTYQDHIFQTGTTSGINSRNEVLRIKNNGNVGIGVNSPNNKLHVNGSMSVGSGYNTAGPTNGLIVQGNVGIGVTNPSTYSSQLAIETSQTRAIMAFNTALADAGTLYGLGFGYAMSNYNSAYISFYKVGNSSTSNRLSFSLWNQNDILNINGAGNVGIGITVPLAQLHINEATSGAAALRVDGTNGTLFSVVDDLSDSLMSVNNSAGLPVLEVFADDRVVMGQYGANDFVLRNNKIGVGTSLPSSQLEVGNVNTSGSGITVSARYDQSEAYIRFRTGHPNNSNVWETANISATDGGNYNGTLSFRTAVSGQSSPSTKMTILPTGNVGINNTNPVFKLDVNGTSGFRDSMAFGPSVGLISWGSMGGGTGFGMRAESGRALSLGANGSFDHIVINTSGNVGIGTTSPVSPLTVYNNSDVWHFRLGGASGELRMGGQTNSGAVIQAYTPGGSVRDLYLQRDGGNIGISTNSPTAKLHMVATGGDGTPALRIVGSASDTFNWASSTMYANLVATETAIHLIGKAQSQYNSAYLGYRHVADGSSSNMLSLGLYSADHLVNILGNGNVGIGTTEPATKLDVFGPISIRGTKVLSTGFDDFGGLAYDIYGNIRVLRSTSAQGDGMYIGYGGSGGPLRFFSNSGTTEFMTIATSGNIGINSTSPNAKLHIIGATNTDAGIRGGTIHIRDSTASSSPATAGMAGIAFSSAPGTDWAIGKYWSGTTSRFVIKDAGSAIGTNLLSIDANGNVGIGASSPTYKLQIGTVGSLADSIRIGTYLVAKNTRQYIGYTRDDTGLFESAGDGDTPATVKGGVAGIRIVNTTGTLASAYADNSVQLLTHIFNGGSRVVLHANYDGNVGIGTSVPAALLQIGSGTPTSATGGLQFGDDTGTRLYRSSSGVITCSGTIAATFSGNLTGNVTGNASGSSTFVASLGSGLNYDNDRTTKRAGLSHYSGYSTGTNRPTTYDYTLQVTDGNKGWEISMDWIATTGPAIYARSLRDCCQNWSSWVRILDSANYSFAANMNQNVRTTDGVTFANITGNGQLNINHSTPTAVARLWSGGSTIWSLGVGDASGSYFNISADFGSFTINKSNGYVGIGTTSQTTRLQLGSGTPTASADGIQFGGDTSARIYRSSSAVVSVSNSFAAANGYVYASNYLQTGNNLIYPAGFSSTQRLAVGNAAQNNWIDGLTLAPGGNVVIAGTLTESSSIRYKENIETISAPILPKLNKIRPVTYNKKDNPNNIEYGIIAEELNELFPEFVNKNENGEVESVNYSRLTVILIKAVKELQEEVEKLKNK